LCAGGRLVLVPRRCLVAGEPLPCLPTGARAPVTLEKRVRMATFGGEETDVDAVRALRPPGAMARCARPSSPPSTPRRCKRATSCVLSPKSTASRGGGREADRTQLPRARASARASGVDPPRRRDLTRADPFACVPRYRSHESRDGARSSERPQAGPIATARMSSSSRRRPSSATWAASIASSGSLSGSASVLHHVPGLDSDRVRGKQPSCAFQTNVWGACGG
jgi:hypothetical protein